MKKTLLALVAVLAFTIPASTAAFSGKWVRDPAAAAAGGSIAAPIAQMEREHDDAGGALRRLRDLTEGFVPPPEACNTHRALLAGLAHLEADLHLHVHKENNVLFPRALARETQPVT